MIKHAAALLLAFALALPAGAKTKVVSSDTKAPPEAPPKKILVLVVSQEPSLREAFEDVIAGELSLRGAKAVASHLSFPELPKDREVFAATLITEGFDAVTVSRLIGSEEKIKFTEGHGSYATTYQGMDWWGGYWYTYEKVFVPGYLNSEKKVSARTDLWRTEGVSGKLVWSGVTQTMDPRNVPQAAKEAGTAIAKALAKAKAI